MKTRKLLIVLSVLMLVLASAVNVSAAAAPDPAWFGAGPLQYAFVYDCTGPDAQSVPDGNGIEPMTACQNYAELDLYESLEHDSTGPDAADIVVFFIGGDADFIYFEIQMAKVWSNDDADGHEVVVDMDVDNDGEGDYYFMVQTKKEYLSEAGWVEAHNASHEIYFDANNDASGTDSALAASGNFNSDGYETDMQPANDDYYVRIYAEGDYQLVQLAVRRSLLGLEPHFSGLSARAWNTQQSSIPKDKLYWNEHQTIPDLAGWDFDNTPFTSGTTSVALSSVAASGGGFAVMGLIFGAGALALPVIKKRK